MTTTDSRAGDRPAVLLPVAILEGQVVPDGIPVLLSRARVIVLGYHVVPDQTPPGQARMQFENRAETLLEGIERQFEGAVAAVETRLVFTHDREETFDRVGREEAVDGTLILNPAPAMDRVLVPIRGEVGVDRIASIAAELLADTGMEATLYYASASDEDPDEARAVLDRATGILTDRGVPPGAIGTTIETTGEPVRSIVAAAEGHDAVIMGESDPGVETFLFGEESKQVAERFVGPVLVVRRGGDRS